MGMTQRFAEDGDMISVTAIKCGPCRVVQKKAKAKEGYDAIQLGFDPVVKAKNISRAEKGHFQKAGTPVFRHLGEVRISDLDAVEVGDALGAQLFKVGDRLDITGVTKGKGFQGVIKKFGMGGGPASHGSCFHRAPGSIGMRQDPGRVLKGTHLPGHMGCDRRTVKNLEVVDINSEGNVVFVRGSVPGHVEGLLRLENRNATLSERFIKGGADTEKKEEVKKDAEV